MTWQLIKCLFGKHLMLEWDHGYYPEKLRRKLFITGTVILKKPYCIACGNGEVKFHLNSFQEKILNMMQSKQRLTIFYPRHAGKNTIRKIYEQQNKNPH